MSFAPKKSDRVLGAKKTMSTAKSKVSASSFKEIEPISSRAVDKTACSLPVLSPKKTLKVDVIQSIFSPTDLNGSPTSRRVSPTNSSSRPLNLASKSNDSYLDIEDDDGISISKSSAIYSLVDFPPQQSSLSPKLRGITQLTFIGESKSSPYLNHLVTGNPSLGNAAVMMGKYLRAKFASEAASRSGSRAGSRATSRQHSRQHDIPTSPARPFRSDQVDLLPVPTVAKSSCGSKPAAVRHHSPADLAPYLAKVPSHFEVQNDRQHRQHSQHGDHQSLSGDSVAVSVSLKSLTSLSTLGTLKTAKTSAAAGRSVAPGAPGIAGSGGSVLSRSGRKPNREDQRSNLMISYSAIAKNNDNTSPGRHTPGGIAGGNNSLYGGGSVASTTRSSLHTVAHKDPLYNIYRQNLERENLAVSNITLNAAASISSALHNSHNNHYGAQQHQQQQMGPETTMPPARFATAIGAATTNPISKNTGSDASLVSSCISVEEVKLLRNFSTLPTDVWAVCRLVYLLIQLFHECNLTSCVHFYNNGSVSHHDPLLLPLTTLNMLERQRREEGMSVAAVDQQFIWPHLQELLSAPKSFLKTLRTIERHSAICSGGRPDTASSVDQLGVVEAVTEMQLSCLRGLLAKSQGIFGSSGSKTSRSLPIPVSTKLVAWAKRVVSGLYETCLEREKSGI